MSFAATDDHRSRAREHPPVWRYMVSARDKFRDQLVGGHSFKLAKPPPPRAGGEARNFRCSRMRSASAGWIARERARFRASRGTVLPSFLGEGDRCIRARDAHVRLCGMSPVVRGHAARLQTAPVLRLCGCAGSAGTYVRGRAGARARIRAPPRTCAHPRRVVAAHAARR